MTAIAICLVVTTMFITSCNDDDNGPDNTSPIRNLVLPPSDIPISSNDAITILGEGFTETSSIWLKNLSDNKIVQTTITEVTSTSITFSISENVAGSYEVFLKKNNKDYSLGTLTFETNSTQSLHFYTFCYDDNKNELVEINIESGTMTWTGMKIPNYGSNSRGYVYDKSRNEFITFGYDDNYNPTINRLNVATKNVITKTANNPDNNNFDNIIGINNKFYTFCYDDAKNELAEINIESGTMTWTGMKIPNYGSNSRGYVYDGSRNEFITFGYDDDYNPIINRLNLATKNVVSKTINNPNKNNFYNIIKANDKFYTFCYDDAKNEFAEINIENGTLTWTGIKIPNYGSNSRGYVYDESRNEFVTFGYDDNYNPTINRANLATKSIITKTINNPDNNNFDEIISW